MGCLVLLIFSCIKMRPFVFFQDFAFLVQLRSQDASMCLCVAVPCSSHGSAELPRVVGSERIRLFSSGRDVAVPALWSHARPARRLRLPRGGSAGPGFRGVARRGERFPRGWRRSRSQQQRESAAYLLFDSVRFFNFCQCDGCKIVSNCGLHLHFPDY